MAVLVVGLLAAMLPPWQLEVLGLEHRGKAIMAAALLHLLVIMAGLAAAVQAQLAQAFLALTITAATAALVSLSPPD